MYMVVNSVRADIKFNRDAAIRAAEQVSKSRRTLVYEWKPRGESKVIWDTGRERVAK